MEVTGPRPSRAGDARTGQMAEFDAARDLTPPVPPHERWSQAQLRCDYLHKKQKQQKMDKKTKTKQSECGTGTVGGLICAIGSRGVGEGDVEWYCQANVFAWCA